MDVLLAFVLSGGLFLALELLWGQHTDPDPPSELWVEWEQQSIEAEFTPVWDPLALPFVRRRLDALDLELERLELDESIYARAFRYQVAQIAYRALLADAARLATVPRPMYPDSSGTTTTVIETTPVTSGVDALRSAGTVREVLEV